MLLCRFFGNETIFNKMKINFLFKVIIFTSIITLFQSCSIVGGAVGAGLELSQDDKYDTYTKNLTKDDFGHNMEKYSGDCDLYVKDNLIKTGKCLFRDKKCGPEFGFKNCDPNYKCEIEIISKDNENSKIECSKIDSVNVEAKKANKILIGLGVGAGIDLLMFFGFVIYASNALNFGPGGG